MFSRINKLKCILTFIIAIVIPPPLMAANSVDIQMTCLEQHDTIWIHPDGNPAPATFDIFIENDVAIGGISLGLKIWSPGSATWEYRDVSDSFDLPDTSYKYISVAPGSRLDPPEGAFDLTGLLLDESSMDGTDHDTIHIGGVSLMQSLLAGPHEHMMSLHFKPGLSCPPSLICIDSTFVPPAGNFVFSDVDGRTFAPEVLWESGGKCWPIIPLYHIHIAGEIKVEPFTIYARDAYSAEPDTVILRLGNFCSDLYGAEEIEWTYINYGLNTFSKTVIDSFPGFDGPVLEICADRSEFILNYPDLWWNVTTITVIADGDFVGGAVLDAYGSFTAIGLTPGDANGDDIADVGDVVRIVDYLERGGTEPIPWETADADGNGTVQMADIIYLINYIFRHGPPPTHP